MIKINLLPVKEAKKKATVQNQLIGIAIVFMVVFAGLGYRAYTQIDKTKQLNNDIAQKQKELADLKEIQKKVEQFKKDNENLTQKISVITDLETGRDWYLQIIDQLSEAMPEGVWIESLNTGGKGANIYQSPWEIKGGALERDQVGNLISNLESRNKFFSSVSLKKITKSNKPDVGEYFPYELSITVTKPPKAEIEGG